MTSPQQISSTCCCPTYKAIFFQGPMNETHTSGWPVWKRQRITLCGKSAKSKQRQACLALALPALAVV